jgi:predicted N-acetyltransferase YhbS
MSQFLRLPVSIREENDEDHQAVYQVLRDAFWNLYTPGMNEHYLVHRLRQHPDAVPELTLVATHTDDCGREEIVGFVMGSKASIRARGRCESSSSSISIITRTSSTIHVHAGYELHSRIEDAGVSVVALAPLAVSPKFHGRGIGSELMTDFKRRAAALGYGAVVLLGYPHYYSRFGFMNGKTFGIGLGSPSQVANENGDETGDDTSGGDGQVAVTYPLGLQFVELNKGSLSVMCCDDEQQQHQHQQQRWIAFHPHLTTCLMTKSNALTHSFPLGPSSKHAVSKCSHRS